jgi:hypothetical protein
VICFFYSTAGLNKIRIPDWSYTYDRYIVFFWDIGAAIGKPKAKHISRRLDILYQQDSNRIGVAEKI